MMNLYLDDDSANGHLVQLLPKEGHHVVIPADIGYSGSKDARHFIRAISQGWVFLTHNHDDFELLHELVILVGGHHPGILAVRKDNDPRDMKPRDIVRAIRNLEAAGAPIADQLNVLNHWR